MWPLRRRAYGSRCDRFRCKYTKVSEKCVDLADELALEKAVKIGPNHETNSNSLKKPSKDEDLTVNAIEKKKRPKQMRPRNKGQEKKRETNKSKDNCGRCGYDKTHKKCPAVGQRCAL